MALKYMLSLKAKEKLELAFGLFISNAEQIDDEKSHITPMKKNGFTCHKSIFHENSLK